MQNPASHIPGQPLCPCPDWFELFLAAKMGCAQYEAGGHNIINVIISTMYYYYYYGGGDV